jgi:hypothetical protein
MLSFRDIFLPDPEQAVSLIITDETNAGSILLTEHTEILDFYTVMDNYQFTTATENATELNYSIEIVTAAPDESDYILMVGDNVTVRYVVGAITSEKLYQATDLEAFQQAVTDFYQKYNQ